ncbi:MAG TPA: hypothetical protein VIJ14_11150 [Rhabdochlamydiaceae bacterium]
MAHSISSSNRNHPSTASSSSAGPQLPATLNTPPTHHAGQKRAMAMMVSEALAQRERVEGVLQITTPPPDPVGMPLPHNISYMVTHVSQPVDQSLPAAAPAAAQGPAQSKSTAPDKVKTFNMSTPESYASTEHQNVEKRKKIASNKLALIESNDRINTAGLHIQQKQFHEALQAIRQAYSILSGEAFIFGLLTGLDTALYHCLEPWVISPNEGDMDLLILRGIYNIKHSHYEEAKRLLLIVLVQEPNERIARLLYDFADNRTRRSLFPSITPGAKLA